jgi:hypothetical protein
MTCRLLSAALLIPAAGLARPALACAQVGVLTASVEYESPSLVAPIGLLTGFSDSRTWTVGFVGWTGLFQTTRVTSPGRATVLRASLTPFNANASRYVYRSGVRDTSLSFNDAALELSAGIRRGWPDGARAELRVIGLYESLGRLPDSVLQHWRSPFVGLGFRLEASRVRSDDVFDARRDGLWASAEGEALTGSRTWWRTTVLAGGGRKAGALFLRANGTLLLSGNTDVVNRHLVGGNWELEDQAPLYGHRYAEFRIERGAVMGGGVDLRLVGNLELGVRYAYLASPSLNTDGAAIRISTVWNGLTINMGVGAPARRLVGAEWRDAIVFGGVSAATFR